MAVWGFELQGLRKQSQFKADALPTELPWTGEDGSSKKRKFFCLVPKFNSFTFLNNYTEYNSIEYSNQTNSDL